ncbi:MAG: hypothetical protein V4634_05350 [Pseudomonadota bacterium]
MQQAHPNHPFLLEENETIAIYPFVGDVSPVDRVRISPYGELRQGRSSQIICLTEIEGTAICLPK